MNEQQFWQQYEQWSTQTRDAPAPAWKRYEAEASRHDAERRQLHGILTTLRAEAREYKINTIITGTCSVACAAPGIAILLQATTDRPLGFLEGGLLTGLALVAGAYTRAFRRQYAEKRAEIETIQGQQRENLARFTTALRKQDEEFRKSFYRSGDAADT